MKIAAFAPHLVGRMLPGLFSCDLKIGQRARSPGDPWPHFAPSPSWHWMHSIGCEAGLCSSRPMARQALPADVDALLMRMPAPRRADQTSSPQAAGIDRPSVGSMGARHPADAGPPAGQRQLFAETTS